jgi:protocatechuate 3,4-dioxygenase alpha subunit
MMAELTSFQTAGPFLHIGLRAGLEPSRAIPRESAITIEGRLIDGAGAGVPDGVLEFWQPDVKAFHRILTGPDGEFALETRKSPHIAVLVMGRGILTCYFTRIYLEDSDGLDDDPVLRLVPPERRTTLVARKAGERLYHFDVILQGDRETVFFDV